MTEKLTLIFIALLVSPLATAERPDLTKQLKELVEINSGTGNKNGVDKVQAWIASELKSLGFAVEIDKNRLLVATLKGEDDKGITLLTHSDTVFEPTSNFQKIAFSEDGKMASGPGVIDDKGGVIVAFEGLRRFLKEHKPKFTLRFVSSPSEETGSAGLHEAFQTFANDSWIVLGFEPSLENGSIKENRRGDRWYHVTVVGKEAHSGSAHKEGINACNDLANKIAEISKLTDYARNVTVSVGHMQGGKDKYNIVCGLAEAKIDARFVTIQDRDRLHAKMTKILQREFVKGTKTSFKIEDDSPPLPISTITKPYIEKYKKIAGEIENRKVEAELSGGTADINFFSRPGLILIDGLGATGGKMHTEEEFVELSSLDSRAEALNRFLTYICSTPK